MCKIAQILGSSLLKICAKCLLTKCGNYDIMEDSTRHDPRRAATKKIKGAGSPHPFILNNQEV
jgi:hypothetical protein